VRHGGGSKVEEKTMRDYIACVVDQPVLKLTKKLIGAITLGSIFF
jgi:hypothetical protein